MARIFISYSRSDRAFVKRIVPLIRRVDSLWYDDDIHGGAEWWQMILNEIAQSDLFIYLISNKSLESPYCQAELREALRLNKSILPVVVQRLRPTYPGNIEESLADFLRKTQYIDMSSGLRDTNKIALLFAAIHRLLTETPEQHLQPTSSTPIPEPQVQDKKSRRTAVLGGVLFFATLIILLVVLTQTALLNPPGTATNVALITEDISQSLADDPTTPEATAEATEADNTDLSPIELAQRGVTSNEEWEPYERIFDDIPINLHVEPRLNSEIIRPLELTETATVLNRNSDQTWAYVRLADNTSGWVANFAYQNNAIALPDFEMVLVPAGCSHDGGDCFPSFWIDKTEVTNRQYSTEGYWGYRGDTRPRDSVTWDEANEFCRMRDARLPTEAEWEYAARGPDGLDYPWRGGFDATLVVYDDIADQSYDAYSIPEGASWVGAYHMSGNLWEWTQTFIDPVYIIRGGSWDSSWTKQKEPA